VNSVSSFEDLQVFQRAYKVSLQIHKLSLTMPKAEQIAGIADQMRRASKGICANIAEGYGKQHISKKEFLRYITIAIGSANEMRVWIRYALDLGYITQQDWEYYKDEYEQIAKMLTGLHRNWH
jgi:four helix bundle protein